MPKCGYSDVGEAWREELGMEDVVATVLSLWSEVKPLYRELHAYTRHKLLKLYGDAEVGPYIHAHLLVNLWAENWLALSDVLLPFPTSTPWTFRNHSHLLQTAEHFYTTMGFDAMRPTFWSHSMFVKPKDRLVDCHAMAYDFGLNQDYRVRMCVGEGPSFAEAVHELGHVHYSASYRRLPARLRRPPNSAFHEAVGETLAMAAHSPRCAHKTGT
ncbi:hypothetical protein JTE90_010863 [Oedothorax gibbosus]|uniref:Angiotensin-converting enzyme n=1 Tax=Oedothorax gibbosus TaxID=931172 RepID=A0AAV6V2U4_9ARAC|nr:hypothetical protein JTE90_010863 [Oedothorax gibbosus]